MLILMISDISNKKKAMMLFIAIAKLLA